MDYRFEIAPQALRDAQEAYRWILERSKSRPQADRWYRGLFKEIETIKLSPHRCPVVEESDVFDEEVRELLYGKRRGIYRVLFAVRGDIIHIFTIRHSARGPLEA